MEKRKKVLFLVTYPSPYRVEFFNQLSRFVDVTVLTTDTPEEHSDRNQSWWDDNFEFKTIFLSKHIKIHGQKLCKSVTDYLNDKWDAIISIGYVEPTKMYAFQWMKRHKMPFYLEMDGGIAKPDKGIKLTIKKHFISMPTKWLSSGKITDEYLIHYGAQKDDIYFYPFTSIKKDDLVSAITIRPQDREVLNNIADDHGVYSCNSSFLQKESCVESETGEYTIEKREVVRYCARKILEIQEEKMILSVGQFIPRKGFDILLKAAQNIPKSVGIYIVGGTPTEDLIRLKEEACLENVHFIDFKVKDELANYYRAADIFVMPTREDIWGLVINEALAYGLPIVSTDKCVAGVELVKDNENGFIVPVEDVDALANAINRMLKSDSDDPQYLNKLGAASFEKAKLYTIENMVDVHLKFLDKVVVSPQR